jgi:ribonuclease PH
MTMQRRFLDHPAGSVLITAGQTRVLCCASIVPGVPAWREASGQGWLTAEYEMLPAATHTRRPRDRTKVDGRSQEIQRLIGRSLRAAVDLSALGAHTIHIDCDVLQADGGTRTASITGAYVALRDALAAGAERHLWSGNPHRTAVAAVSVGIVSGEPKLDLDYAEDAAAEVDCNLVLTGTGEWIEWQATGEDASFSDAQIAAMTAIGRAGLTQLLAFQQRVLEAPPGEVIRL